MLTLTYVNMIHIHENLYMFENGHNKHERHQFSIKLKLSVKWYAVFPFIVYL